MEQPGGHNIQYSHNGLALYWIILLNILFIQLECFNELATECYFQNVLSRRVLAGVQNQIEYQFSIHCNWMQMYNKNMCPILCWPVNTYQLYMTVHEYSSVHPSICVCICASLSPTFVLCVIELRRLAAGVINGVWLRFGLFTRWGRRAGIIYSMIRHPSLSFLVPTHSFHKTGKTQLTWKQSRAYQSFDLVVFIYLSLPSKQQKIRNALCISDCQ